MKSTEIEKVVKMDEICPDFNAKRDFGAFGTKTGKETCDKGLFSFLRKMRVIVDP